MIVEVKKKEKKVAIDSYESHLFNKKRKGFYNFFLSVPCNHKKTLVISKVTSKHFFLCCLYK